MAAKKKPIEAGKPFADLLGKLVQVPKEEVGKREIAAAKRKSKRGRPKKNGT